MNPGTFDKLTFIYLEMPKFKKTEDELVTLLDKWLFVLSNLSRLMDRPAAMQERVFARLFEQAEIAKFTPEERREYYDNYKAYRDINNAVNTARKEGNEEGREAKAIEIARNLKILNIPVTDISKATGLTAEEISNL